MFTIIHRLLYDPTFFEDAVTFLVVMFIFFGGSVVTVAKSWRDHENEIRRRCEIDGRSVDERTREL